MSACNNKVIVFIACNTACCLSGQFSLPLLNCCYISVSYRCSYDIISVHNDKPYSYQHLCDQIVGSCFAMKDEQVADEKKVG